jgi:hypothetical protein
MLAHQPNLLLRTACGLMLVIVSHATWAWTPPAHPDPSAILNEADADAHAGRMADAASKYLWFHREAVGREPSLSGVRVSFALHAWADLAKRDAATMSDFRAERDSTWQSLRDIPTGRRERARDLFAMNRVIADHASSVEVYEWLDRERPELAIQLLPEALPALVATGSVDLAARRLDPPEALKAATRSLKLMREHRPPLRTTEEAESFDTVSERRFAQEAGRIVWVLVQSHREAEAQTLTRQAQSELRNPVAMAELKNTLTGRAPGDGMD